MSEKLGHFHNKESVTNRSKSGEGKDMDKIIHFYGQELKVGKLGPWENRSEHRGCTRSAPLRGRQKTRKEELY
ncbi:hypothetical protein QJS04_geneDACA019792 [Acorus gramineus]|uniref:Uncharacterized protein n=1 Tax=Acorus gramineus TaxID=55184 RepID=A0AAV9A1F5_ACOGR|nr:hypothetical protein QJS04_geneDACA019792 [Acorus gramineus]